MRSTRLTRKRVARHATGCEHCEPRWNSSPDALGVLAVAPMLGAPAALKSKVLNDPRLISTSRAARRPRLAAQRIPACRRRPPAPPDRIQRRRRARDRRSSRSRSCSRATTTARLVAPDFSTSTTGELTDVTGSIVTVAPGTPVTDPAGQVVVDSSGSVVTVAPGTPVTTSRWRHRHHAAANAWTGHDDGRRRRNHDAVGQRSHDNGAADHHDDVARHDPRDTWADTTTRSQCRRVRLRVAPHQRGHAVCARPSHRGSRAPCGCTSLVQPTSDDPDAAGPKRQRGSRRWARIRSAGKLSLYVSNSAVPAVPRATSIAVHVDPCPQ